MEYFLYHSTRRLIILHYCPQLSVNNLTLFMLFQGGNYIYNSIGDNGGYSFSWNVQDAYNDFGHREDRGLGKSGIDETRGSYHVQLPDGRVQTVTYFVDPYNGYQVNDHRF